MGLASHPSTRKPIEIASLQDPALLDALKGWARGVDTASECAAVVDALAALVASMCDEGDEHAPQQMASLAIRAALAGSGDVDDCAVRVVKAARDEGLDPRLIAAGLAGGEPWVEALAVRALDRYGEDLDTLPIGLPPDADRWRVTPWSVEERRRADHRLNQAAVADRSITHERSLFASVRVLIPGEPDGLAPYAYLDRIPATLQAEIGWEMHGRIHRIQLPSDDRGK